MLKGIDPLLTPELLRVLAEMGHGDEIVVADANFTATSLARGRPVITLAGAVVQRACEALLSLLPLDAMVAQPVAYMQVGDTPPGYRSALQRQVVARLGRRAAVLNPKKISMSDTVAVMTGAMPPEQIPQECLA